MTGKLSSSLILSIVFCTTVSSLPFDPVLPPPLPLPLSNAQLAASARLACRPAGHCEICPESQMLEPACRLYGNRRLVHCLVLDVPEPQIYGAPPPMPSTHEEIAQVPADGGEKAAETVEEQADAPAKQAPADDVHPHLLDDAGSAKAGKQVVHPALPSAAQQEYDESGQLPADQAEKAKGLPGGKETTADATDASKSTTIPLVRYKLKRATFDPSHSMIGSLQETFASWEPCARAIETEQKDFWEFILCNLTFATVALFVIVIRGRILAGRRFNAIMSSMGYPIHLLTQGASRPT